MRIGCRTIGKLSTRLLNICVTSLCKGKQINKAELVIIDGIRLGVLPDVVTYNALIDGYGHLVSFDAAYSVIYRMREAKINPDVITYNTLIATAARNCLFSKCFDLFDEMFNVGIVPDIWSYNTLMHCFFKHGKPEEANRIFRYVMVNDEKKLHPSSATVNIMLNGLCENGYVSNAVRLFRNLQRRYGFVPELVTYNIIINGLCKEWRLRAARRILNELETSGYVSDAITYTTVLKCCFKSRRYFEQGLELLEEMFHKGYSFDGYAYCTVASALIKRGRTDLATKFMERMAENGIEYDLASYNTLMNLYCKEGNLEASYELLDKMEKEGLEWDKYTHTILINGLCKAGNTFEALQHMQHMNMIDSDSNLVASNCILDGLCKEGRIDQALEIFKSMETKDSFTYTSLVHNLCKARDFRRASNLLLVCEGCGMKLLPSAKKALIGALRYSGLHREARKLKADIRLAQTVQK